MPLSVNFSTSQTPGLPGNITFTDLSTGSDVTVTQRRIYIQMANGTFLVPEGVSTEYNEWPDFPSDTEIELEDVLPYDVGARVVVEWCTSGGNVVDSKTSFIGFNCYNEDFDYQLTQNVASNQMLMNDNNFWGNKNLLQTLIDSGDKAISRASDTNAAQQCYNKATELREDAQYAFNQNA